MSLILDALKKSENERRRQQNPSIADVRVAQPEQKPPVWLWWLLGLLAVNLLVLAIVLLGRPGPAPERQRTEVEIPATPPAAQTSAPRVQLPPPKEEVRSLSREIVAAEPAPATAEPRTRRENPPASVATAPAPDPVTAEPAESRPVGDPGVPYFEELRGAGTLNLPDLNIELHVYHPTPASRMVYINGRKYLEGATLNDGPDVVAIRADGVLLRHRGIEFLLPRD